MSQQTINMKLVKSTKGTHVYGDVSDNAPIPTLYVKRTALPSTPPESIEITITHDGS